MWIFLLLAFNFVAMWSSAIALTHESLIPLFVAAGVTLWAAAQLARAQ